MTKWLLLILTVLVSVPTALAQSSDYSRYEFYGGYAYQRTSNNAASISTDGNVFDPGPIIHFDSMGGSFPGGIVHFDSRGESFGGFTAEFNQNINRRWGLVTSFTGVYDNAPVYTTNTPHRVKASRYDLLFGPRYNFRLGRLNPFAEGMAGFEHMSVRINGDFGKVVIGDTAFAMAVGGGVDVHVSHHFDIRAVQADYLPTFFNGTHQNNYRVGAGVKLKIVDP